MTKCNQLFAIQDSEGKYVDQHSIWHNSETDKWIYTSYETTHSGGLWWIKSEEEAEMIIEDLEKNLHRVAKDFKRTFSIIQIV